MRLRLAAVALIVALVGGLAAAAYTAIRAPGSDAIPHFPPPIVRDLDAILERDTLVALTSYGSTSYFLWRGEPFGFEYELLNEFGRTHGVAVRMLIAPRDSLLHLLNRGVGDIIAAGLIPGGVDTARFRYTEALYRTRPVVVQRGDGAGSPGGPAARGATPPDIEVLPRSIDTTIRPEGPVVPEPFRIRARPVRRVAELSGRRVHVQEGHPYVDRLVELHEEVSGDIRIVEVDTTTENLIRRVAYGAIDLTVAPENIADLEESYYTNLAVRPVLGRTHPVTWAVRANAPGLRRALDIWIARMTDSREFDRLYEKYFVDRQAFRERVESRYLTGETRVLSDFDDVLRSAAESIGWDWRLLASQAYQESRFDPDARSWAGAQGLLQLMPATAAELRVRNPWNPRENAMGAARYLRWLTSTYWEDEIADPGERLKFILASYNAGPGHIMDARRLAAAAGADPDVWADVAYWLLQKSQASVYMRPEVRHGFCRGLEPVQYVARILDRFEHYRQFVPIDPGDMAEVGESGTRGPRRDNDYPAG